MTKTCLECSKRDKCQTLCGELEQAAGAPDGEDTYLVFTEEPREHLEEGSDGFYISRIPDKDARLVSLYDTLRPLQALDDLQAAAIFILMNYFGATKNDICKLFKIGNRRANVIIQRTKGTLASFQDCEDVPEPGRDY